MATEAEHRKQLEREGFSAVFVQRDGAGKHYPPHTHSEISAHIILEGNMELTVEGKRNDLNPGDRFDVPANAVHDATIGARGCTYLIGEK